MNSRRADVDDTNKKINTKILNVDASVVFL